MKVFIKKLKIRNPFEIRHLPWLTQIYLFPIKKNFKQPWQNTVFSLPFLTLFYLLQKIFPFNPKGKFFYHLGKNKIPIFFNGKNVQFESLYRPELTNGYEPEVRVLLDILVPNDGVFYDIGANWGYFSLFVASKPSFKGKIYAFEPYPSSYLDLVDVVSQTKLERKINSLNLALSDFVGIGKMGLFGVYHSGFAFLKNNGEGEEVKVTNLDSLNLAYPPTVMKIDVQGSEEDVLRGAQKTLKKFKPMIIFENCIHYEDTTITTEPLLFLKKLGYELFYPSWLDPQKKIVTTSYTGHLSLVPIDPRKRFLYSGFINIFACHRIKLHLFSGQTKIGISYAEFR